VTNRATVRAVAPHGPFAIVRALQIRVLGDIMAATSNQGHGSEMSSADFNEHMRTWKGFVSFIKYSMIGIGIIMILLAMFRTG